MSEPQSESADARPVKPCGLPRPHGQHGWETQGRGKTWKRYTCPGVATPSEKA